MNELEISKLEKISRKIIEIGKKKAELADTKIEKLRAEGKFKKAEKLEKKKWKVLYKGAMLQCRLDYMYYEKLFKLEVEKILIEKQKELFEYFSIPPREIDNLLRMILGYN